MKLNVEKLEILYTNGAKGVLVNTLSSKESIPMAVK